jgi:hypothetical protein
MNTKILCTLMLALLSLSAFAQDEERKKSSAGDFTAEVNFNPFSSAPVAINYLRFRYFTSETSALRIGVSLGMEKQNPEEDLTLQTLEVNIRPGYEWHLAGTERLSPYFGVEADIAFKNSSYEDTDEDAYVEKIDGAWSTGGTERGFNRFGLNFIVGADFYVARRVYIGTEFGFGFQNIRYADIEVTSPDNEDPIKGGTTFQLGPNFNSSLRLGFAF